MSDSGAHPSPSEHHHHHHDHGPAGVVAGDDVAECPVMCGSLVVRAEAEAAGLVRDYEGKRYWLCCAACGPLFDADPARYATA
jgi:YHS domain-containing protein